MFEKKEGNMSSLQKPHWAVRIEELLHKLGLTQANLAAKLSVSPMTVSRWARGTHRPTAQTYIKLAYLAGSSDRLYFWQQAGLAGATSPAHLLDGESINTSVINKLNAFKMVAGQKVSSNSHEDLAEGIAIPLLNARVHAPAERMGPPQSLDMAKVEHILIVPLTWCTDPNGLIALHVMGDSMSPLIEDGSVVVVDTSRSDPTKLDRKVIVASHRDHGLRACWLRGVGSVHILVAENHLYAPEEFSIKNHWLILGEVIWWITRRPFR